MKDLAMHVMDIARNSVEAGAKKVKVSLIMKKTEGNLVVTFEDDGCGMDAEMVKKATDAYTTSRITRKVGLGLPLFKMNAENTAGSLQIISEPGLGTMVTAVFFTKHIDCVPLGDMAGIVALLICSNQDVMFHFDFHIDERAFAIRTDEIVEVLDGSEINQPKVVRFIKEMVNENLNEIGFQFE